ncbi:YggT family protein [Nocardia sp. NPDC055321]
MSLIGAVLGYILTAFILVMLARLILDWIATLGDNPSSTYRAREITHKLTEPVIAPVRKVLPPIRAGGLAIDLAFTIVFVLAIILRSVFFSL